MNEGKNVTMWLTRGKLDNSHRPTGDPDVEICSQVFIIVNVKESKGKDRPID